MVLAVLVFGKWTLEPELRRTLLSISYRRTDVDDSKRRRQLTLRLKSMYQTEICGIRHAHSLTLTDTFAANSN